MRPSVGDRAQTVDAAETAAVLVDLACPGLRRGFDADVARAGPVDAGAAAAVVVDDAALALALALALASVDAAAGDAGAAIAVALVAADRFALAFAFTLPFSLSLSFSFAPDAVSGGRVGGPGKQGAGAELAGDDEEQEQTRHRGSVVESAGSATARPSW
jgi:hypothetical protein